jgi:predicted nucleotide-binding protein
VSENLAEASEHRELLRALGLFMSDLQVAALEALKLVDEVGSTGATALEVDAARLQGLGDNLIAIQSWIVKGSDLFSGPKVDDLQLLARLNVLRLQAENVIRKPERLALCRYLERSSDIINLLNQPSANNIEFLLKTLQLALEDSPRISPEIETEPSNEPALQMQSKPTKINIFLAAGDAGLTAARALAPKLDRQRVMSREIKVSQSWSRMPNLGEMRLGGVTAVIRSCQYGTLVLTAEETTIGNTDNDSSSPTKGHLRLPPDVEFLLGLMVGAFGMDKTFLVVPTTEKDKPELASFLHGVISAEYDPANSDSDQEMDVVSSLIIKTITDKEKSVAQQGD